MKYYFYLPKARPITMIRNATAKGVCTFATNLFVLFDNEQIPISKRDVERTWSKKRYIWLIPCVGIVTNIPTVDWLLCS